ncbi:MAG: type III-B CRISPR-associated protein Cas10/Cmr2 [Candidatus Binatia bacterium]|nr:type III-B CRISPR-associated protein Cas10/Cmr2 [Candidatus Binatia bacterium]
MTNVDRWTLKIHAFLHDPPHKPLALGRGHAAQGASIAERITEKALSNGTASLIATADHLAAGADRQSWLAQFRVDPKQQLQLIHPLEGKPILQPGTRRGQAFELVFPTECVDAAERIGAQLPGVIGELPNNRLRFLVLWRFLPELLARMEGRQRNLGLLWPLLPADSRMPDHSVLIHDSLVSALATILDQGTKAALLRVQFAPVQDFIEASRKLRDLWASSSILAETTWCAMETIVEEFGPDHVLFPSLRDEPRFDRWLLGQPQLRECAPEDPGKRQQSPLWAVFDETERYLPRALRTPSLPNVFTAVIPYEQAEEIARKVEKKVRAFWEDSVRQAGDCAGEGQEYGERAREQAQALLQVFWSVVPWPLDQSPRTWVASTHETCWHKRTPIVSEALATIDTVEEVFSGYEPNAGLLYPDITDQATLLVDAVKRERAQHVSDEGGLKCSCCGERQVLGGNDFWIQRTEGLAKRKDRKRLSEGEQLCGPCTWKRLFELEGLREEDSGPFGPRHPSTGDVAAAQFKLDVILACRDGNKKLLEKVKAFVDAVQADVSEGRLDEGDTRVFCPQAVDLAARKSEEKTLIEFARIDGQWLLDFPREEAPEAKPEETLRAARELRRAAADANIDAPRPYLAVIDFDGDSMGKWLSGTHEHFPRVLQTLHTKVVEMLKADHPAGWQALAERPRFLSPAFHASLSAAAATFARVAAPMTIEGEALPGHLIYAGGDDALFLAPVPVALELALRLRLRFSGWPKKFESLLLKADESNFAGFRELLRSHFNTPSAWTLATFGTQSGRPEPADQWEQVRKVGLAFGTNATASAGMCVFHYRWPLGSALRMAREALNAAKQVARNSLGIIVQRRSGSISRTVLPFFLKDTSDQASSPTIFPVLSLIEATAAFMKEEQGVSARLATAFREEIAALHIEPRAGRLPGTKRADSQLWDIGEALARRVVLRRDLAGSKRSDESKKENPVRDYLERVVLDLGRGVRATCKDNPVQALFEWSEALTVAAFLARPGERG